jgi:NTP pyrophosphatase (non-canonical NTP hydrolase)
MAKFFIKKIEFQCFRVKLLLLRREMRVTFVNKARKTMCELGEVAKAVKGSIKFDCNGRSFPDTKKRVAELAELFKCYTPFDSSDWSERANIEDELMRLFRLFFAGVTLQVCLPDVRRIIYNYIERYPTLSSFTTEMYTHLDDICVLVGIQYPVE